MNFSRLEKEKERGRLMEDQLQNECCKTDKCKTKIIELKKQVTFLKEKKNILTQENHSLKGNLKDILEAIRIESEKPWWKNFGEILLSSLQNTAHIMLPALPKRPSKDR